MKQGIGNETAGVILLYSFHFPTFVINVYINRLAKRLEIPMAEKDSSLQYYFEKNLGKDVGLFKEYHALVLKHAKKHCRKNRIVQIVRSGTMFGPRQRPFACKQ